MAYLPRTPPSNPALLPQWLQDETRRIAQAMEAGVERKSFRVLYAAPDKYQAGDVVYADGTTWDPGSGEGVYRRSLGGAWVKLG